MAFVMSVNWTKRPEGVGGLAIDVSKIPGEILFIVIPYLAYS